MLHRPGTATPPIVCLSWAGGAHDQWTDIAARLSPHAAVVTYGRPSLGGSDPLPAGLAGRFQSVGWAAAQLPTLLQAARITPPYVLLGSSIAGWVADQYTARWPDEVAGLVLVDPTPLRPWPRLGQEDPIVDGDDTEPGCIRLDWTDSQAELARMVPSLSPLIAARAVVVCASDGHAQRHPPTIRWYEPLTLAEVDSFRQVSQREWVRRIAALHVVADTAGHFVHRDQPDLVAHVAGAVVDAARRGAPVDLVGVDLAAAVGRLRPARS